MKIDKEFHFKPILSAQYFIYFGVLGMFLPYFNLYCFHIGFNGFQIGFMSALRSIVMVLFPLIWGSLADRFGMRRPIYILCCFASAVIWTFYLFTTDFWLMLIITLCYAMFYAPLISFLEAFTMDVLGEEKKSYGKIRAWGSFSFIAVVIILGMVIEIYAIEIILILILAGSFMLATTSFKIPAGKPLPKKRLRPQARSLLNVRVIVFLFCAFLMLVSHGAYYGFFSIHLENLGYSSLFIGLAWALASIAEILVMIRSDRLFKHFSLENVLFFSFVVAALRWFILARADSPVVILVSQVLHAVTYGTFHMSCILFIDRLAPDASKTMGQAVNNAVSYGLGLMVGFFINGYLYEKVGVFNLFFISSIIALAAGIMFQIYRMTSQRQT